MRNASPRSVAESLSGLCCCRCRCLAVDFGRGSAGNCTTVLKAQQQQQQQRQQQVPPAVCHSRSLTY
ncbi:hypothetical protein AWZ03_000005 [Drosophila navojoa]|uniref:Uncharacterized protein n=1 Tax=Drosophila navojoa TaxID=7232 RepID=A0A484BZD3_DRONA|nr:hypothetical protein AWZ03_000005 [Drosophila navojoa]